MGRKEKEVDREKEMRDNRKRRHKGRSASRSKSRSRSRERERLDLSKAKKVKTEREVERPRDDNKGGGASGVRNDFRERDRVKKEDRERDDRRDSGKGRGSPGPVTASSTNETSISIEETNRIRAELGLKPLDMDNDDSESKTEKKDVHIPAVNIREKKATEELKRKLDERREKRKIEQRLAHVRTIAETVSDDDDDASNWVEKSRRVQKEKEDAAKRAKMLEQLDEEFGVAAVLENEIVKEKSRSYTSKHLTGLRVEHDKETLGEGKVVVLTLKDVNVLGGDEDVLVNVNMLDDERYKKNNEIKKQKPGYQAYDDDADVDMDASTKSRSLLAKYDTEIDGDKKESFVIGGDASEKSLKDAEKARIKLKLDQKRLETLESRPLKIASEYYTEQEMSSFKKVKRRVKKVRQPTSLKADDLLADAIDSEQHLGSRTRKVKLEDDDLKAEDLSGVKLTFDEARVERRRPNIRKRVQDQWPAPESLVIKTEPEDDAAAASGNGASASNIVLNATAEFCRTLGEIPTYGMAGNRDEDEDELMGFERQLAEERRRNQEKEERRKEAERLQERGGWNVLDKNAHSDDSMDVDGREQENATVILDEEPDVGSGMAAALKLAMSKGYLEKEEKKRTCVSKSGQELLAQHYTIEDKAVDDDKYSRRNRYDGPVVEFKDKEGYKPEIKLDYIDDGGKMLSTKEAFRHLSHKFHGKGSGKLKSEKRAKKQEDKMLMNRMSSTDTPLNTLKKLQDKQKELQSPYVVLSGKLTSTSIAKPGKGKK